MAGRIDAGRWARIAAVLALAATAGHAASLAGVPLAWVLGPMIVTAAASIAGSPVWASKRGRQYGQLLVGSSIGLNVTAAALGLIVQWLPAMVATAAAAMLISAVISVPFARASRIDQTTAFFSLTPGGLSEMANVGQAEGADPEPIALSQAIRVALLVCLMPPLILTFGIDGGIPTPDAGGRLEPLELAMLLGTSLAAISVLKLLRANNAWMIGALLGGGLLAGLEFVDGRMPFPLFAAGQFLIGIAIGARFKRENLTKLPRVCVMVIVFICILTGLLFAYALLLSTVTGIDLSSATLSSSPGGLAEMSLTAQVLHLNVALVTAFHVVRSFFVNAFTLPAFRLFRRIGLFRGVGALCDRFARP
ncbi:MAG TPA: AbrB family transcriptional regulator [Methylomirabilota bacterium]|nr:AbrB family transcriptional regulator [Methylomirabilota bacterium]